MPRVVHPGDDYAIAWPEWMQSVFKNEVDISRQDDVEVHRVRVVHRNFQAWLQLDKVPAGESWH
jgi:hypothetical protein